MSLAADRGEDLEDGHRATTPHGDNLLLDFARTEAEAYLHLLAANGGRVAIDEPGLHACDLGCPTPFGNVAMLARPVPDAEVPDVAARIRTAFVGHPGGPYLLFSPWPIADLSVHGFSPVGHPPLMLRPPGGDPPPPPRDAEVLEVDDADGLAELERALIEGYPIEELQPWQRECYLHPDVLGGRWRWFAARDESGTLATAGAWLGDHVTVVEFVSTRTEARRRGIGAAVTAAAALADPEKPAMLISSDDGHGVYGSIGFRTLLRYALWLGHR